MKNITLHPWRYREHDYIRIDPSADPEIELVLNSCKALNWLEEHGFYASKHSRSALNTIFQHLREEGFYVDYSRLKSHTNPSPITRQPSQTQPAQSDLANFHSWLHQLRYSKNTINTYTGLLKVFFEFFPDKDPKEINKGDVESFNQEYILKRGYSRVFQNQLISALKLYYIRYHDRELDIDLLERPRKERKLPEVLSKEEVVELLTAVKNSKHRFLLSLIYSCGLRIGEALNLRLNDLDTTRRFAHIRHAKGAKDRFIPLSEHTLVKLRDYLRTYRPADFVFEGRDGGPYTASSARQVLKRALQQTNITKRVTLHTLRHSYATHLLENGTDIRYIQELLGHNDPKTTMIYTHVSTSSLQKIRNPFDDLDL